MSIEREQGFTLIELLILTVVVGILATLVAMTYSGVQVTNRNSNRQANIDVIQSQLENYYAKYSQYPNITELNSESWRTKNMKEINLGDMRDPSWDKKSNDCTANQQPIFTAQPTKNCYSYQATTADGSPCVAADVTCTQYTLTATLEGGEKYVKSSLN
ncbi:MAG TPA: type II secretion system protein [Candidatus Saccharimonadales bacterium]|nr:type II secretion system protein [Candidatus Saccharimonadales bacterium]